MCERECARARVCVCVCVCVLIVPSHSFSPSRPLSTSLDLSRPLSTSLDLSVRKKGPVLRDIAEGKFADKGVKAIVHIANGHSSGKERDQQLCTPARKRDMCARVHGVHVCVCLPVCLRTHADPCNLHVQPMRPICKRLRVQPFSRACVG